MKVVCENIVNAVPDVVRWNSWDGEHLKTVHSAYTDPLLLVSRQNESLFIDRIKIPFLGLKVKTMVFTLQMDETTQVSYTMTPFFLAKNTIKLTEIEPKKTLVKVTYEFSGNLFQKILFPIHRILIKKWNGIVWKEDLPLKLRRQKALEYGFIDYFGLPDKLQDRNDISLIHKTELPVKRPSNIRETSHPFFIQQ